MEVTGTAMLLGWIAERVLDAGIRIPGIGAAAGVCGYYFGAWLWDLTGWSDGPLIAGFPIVPTFAGALAVCGFLKLVGLPIVPTAVGAFGVCGFLKLIGLAADSR